MALRSSWKGFLKLSLISVPVKAYTATTSGGADIRLNQIHAGCNSRIQQKKFCPIHGELKSDEIVSGYETAKGQYVLINTDELSKLRSEDDKAIKIDVFFHAEALDPIYFSGRSYYLVPDGPVGQKPYSVILRAMAEANCYAIAQVVFSGREQVVLLRPMGHLLVMAMLHLDEDITKPSAVESEVPKVEIAPEELALAKTLIKASTPEKLDYERYKDLYTERLTKLIEAKVEGKEIVAPPAQEESQAINLMDALRESVAKAQKQAGGAQKPEKTAAAPAAAETEAAEEKVEIAKGKPPKKMAKSVQKKEETKPSKKKKSS
jgi:DNA end-binding protein Ku